jgi:hypothetical protein
MDLLLGLLELEMDQFQIKARLTEMLKEIQKARQKAIPTEIVKA